MLLPIKYTGDYDGTGEGKRNILTAMTVCPPTGRKDYPQGQRRFNMEEMSNKKLEEMSDRTNVIGSCWDWTNIPRSFPRIVRELLPAGARGSS